MMIDESAPTACEDVRTGLSARHDGEHPAPAGELDRHLARCAECAGFERALASLGARVFDPLRAAEPPRGLAGRIAARAAQAGQGGPRRVDRGVARLARGLAAALVGFLGVQLLASRAPTDERSSALELREGAGHALAHPADHPPPELARVRLFETETEARR
jgi:hypothetical protein